MAIGSGGLKNLEDGAGVFGPDGGLRAELFPALRGELVVLGFAIVLGKPPFGLEQSAFLHAVERGVERALLDLESLVGGLADPRRDGVAVARTPGEGLEDEEVERALEEVEIDGRPRVSPEMLMGMRQKSPAPNCNAGSPECFRASLIRVSDTAVSESVARRALGPDYGTRSSGDGHRSMRASATPFVQPNPSCVGYSPPPARFIRSTTSYFSVIRRVSS